MGKQEFCCVRCFQCKTFQSTLTKKTKKFNCAVCGQNQSVQHTFAVSNSAKEVRDVVMQLNLAQGTLDEARVELTAAATDPAPRQIDNDMADVARAAQLEWGEYVEEDEDAPPADDDLLGNDSGSYVTSLPEACHGSKRRKMQHHHLDGQNYWQGGPVSGSRGRGRKGMGSFCQGQGQKTAAGASAGSITGRGASSWQSQPQQYSSSLWGQGTAARQSGAQQHSSTYQLGCSSIIASSSRSSSSNPSSGVGLCRQDSMPPPRPRHLDGNAKQPAGQQYHHQRQQQRIQQQELHGQQQSEPHQLQQQFAPQQQQQQQQSNVQGRNAGVGCTAARGTLQQVHNKPVQIQSGTGNVAAPCWQQLGQQNIPSIGRSSKGMQLQQPQQEQPGNSSTWADFLDQEEHVGAARSWDDAGQMVQQQGSMVAGGSKWIGSAAVGMGTNAGGSWGKGTADAANWDSACFVTDF